MHNGSLGRDVCTAGVSSSMASHCIVLICSHIAKRLVFKSEIEKAQYQSLIHIIRMFVDLS